MKFLLPFLLLFSINSYGQEKETPFDGHKWEAPYELPVPPKWTIERFLVPPSFAPAIRYKGVEDIRFTPGWADAGSEEYWSYAFLWWLEEQARFSKNAIKKDLKSYYTGLVKVNTDPNKYGSEKPVPVTVKLKREKPLTGDQHFYTGSIRVRDFISRKEMVLYCKIHITACPGNHKSVLFFELSPQPFSHKTWSSLGKLWQDFNCKKK